MTPRPVARAAVDADLGGPQGGPRQLVKRADAAGFATVGTVGSGTWPARDGIERPESSLLIRGTKDGQRFAAIWRTVEGLTSQPGAICYWWCSELRGRVERDPQTTRDVSFEVAQWKRAHGGKIGAAKERELRSPAFETVGWTAPRLFPVRVGYEHLLKILSDPELWERPWKIEASGGGTATTAPVDAGRARSAPAKRKVRTDGVS